MSIESGLRNVNNSTTSDYNVSLMAASTGVKVIRPPPLLLLLLLLLLVVVMLLLVVVVMEKSVDGEDEKSRRELPSNADVTRRLSGCVYCKMSDVG